MESAWLDSLSEDWVSQPRSSDSPAASLPSLPNSTPASSPSANSAKPGRIPSRESEKSPTQPGNDPSALPLSERNGNAQNILPSHPPKQKSRLRNEIPGVGHGRKPSRTLSESSAQSMLHNTVHHKSSSSFPEKSGKLQETPEWKRRLLHGDVAYGEQRDLFSPAGLELIFDPPQPPASERPTSAESSERHLQSEDVSMRSSPPPYAPKIEVQSAPMGQRLMSFKLNDTGSDNHSGLDSSQNSSFHVQNIIDRYAMGPPTVQVSEPNEPNASLSKANTDNKVENPRRLMSGQSDIRHEDLSPIYLSRLDTADGKYNYAPVDISATELEDRLRSMNIDNESSISDSILQPKSEGPSATTGDSARRRSLGSIRRNHSGKASVQRRMLNPSAVPSPLPRMDESGVLLEESVQASTPKHLPEFKMTVASDEASGSNSGNQDWAPQTPKSSAAEEKPPISNTSPLKLFEVYDTFTNKRLLRRLSQFEGNSPDEHSKVTTEDTQGGGAGIPKGFEEARPAPSSPDKSAIDESNARQAQKEFSSFGEGKLDHFEFQEEVSFPSWLSSDDEGSIIVQEPREVQPAIFDISHITAEDEDASRDATSTSRTGYNAGESDHHRQKSSFHDQDVLKTPKRTDSEIQLKRLSRSPVKDPTPKRRRTLHESDISRLSGTEMSDYLLENHSNIKTIIGKKRKDARYDDNHTPADPKVMASRQVLRPRTSTPSQHDNDDHGSQRAKTSKSQPSSQEEKQQQQQKIAMVQAELDMTNTTGPVDASDTGSPEGRKPSVTTQDFLDEARKIMAGIRGKARPRGGLSSMEETDLEAEEPGADMDESIDFDEGSSYQESTEERFSRPPSREGGGPRPLPPREQCDPALLNHLKKYEERSEFDAMLASSLRSAAESNKMEADAQKIDAYQDETGEMPSLSSRNDTPYESEPPGIRVTEYPNLQRDWEHFPPPVPDEDVDEGANYQDSNPSSRDSSSRSVPTGSSRGSDSRRVIEPHSISHLIPGQIAGMLYDEKRKAWVKHKHVYGRKGEANYTPSDDDDPFGDIPDLTVDEAHEMQRIQSVVARRREEARLSVIQEYQPSHSNMSQDFGSNLGSIPPEAVGDPVPDHPPSSPPGSSKHIRATSNSSNTADTYLRANSWEGEAEVGTRPHTASTFPEDASHEKGVEEPKQESSVQENETEEVEETVLIGEGKMPRSNGRRRGTRNISFSSPIASYVRDTSPDSSVASSLEDSYNDSQDHAESEEPERPEVQTPQPKHARKFRLSRSSTPRHSSLRGPGFTRRPISRIDERDEDVVPESTNNDDVDKSLSAAITTPIPDRNASKEMSAIKRNSPGAAMMHDSVYQLSPLSDFTMHRPEESFAFDISTGPSAVRRQQGTKSKKALPISVQEIVQRLTDVEPYEPYWEYLKQLELKDSKLQSLHMLRKFCGQLEELDVSENEIAQLDGAPETIRHLRISHNLLSDLTSWHRLHNLQDLDISNNDLRSLDGLSGLVHLRTVRADNNKIKSLAGACNLDSLMELRLRNNAVESVDFTGCKLQRLTVLDLKGNGLNAIRGLQELKSLTSLTLDENRLSTFDGATTKILRSLRCLRLSNNGLREIDVGLYPNLRLLYLDRNQLGNVSNLRRVRHLDSLSLREQQDATLDMSLLDEALEVRKLFLSGNCLTGFAPHADFLNLQYLEMANCGLDSLPANFGQMMANVRVLNLNFNALHDIRPLLGIVRLKRLYLAGNRLSRLRRTTGILGQFSSLASADLRNNHLTLGFYSPLAEKVVVLRQGTGLGVEAVSDDPFTLPVMDQEKDRAYASRLDMETKMRKRVYDMLMTGRCESLRMLDGLPANRESAGVRDAVWEELVRVGLVQERTAGVGTTPQKEFTGVKAEEGGVGANGLGQGDITDRKGKGKGRQEGEGTLGQGGEGAEQGTRAVRGHDNNEPEWAASVDRWLAEDSFA